MTRRPKIKDDLPVAQPNPNLSQKTLGKLRALEQKHLKRMLEAGMLPALPSKDEPATGN